MKVISSILCGFLHQESNTRDIFTIILNLFSNYVLVYFCNFRQFVCLLYTIPEEDAVGYRRQKTYEQKVIRAKSIMEVVFNKQSNGSRGNKRKKHYRKYS
jgi:hypothetical protein